MDNALPPPSSRRRVTRQQNISMSMSTAGPSRLPDAYSDQADMNFGGEPSRENLLDSMSDMDMATPLSMLEETPAARLRKLIHKFPSDPEEPSRSAYAPPSPSERESDYERPNLASSTTSSYRGSLKSLISHAKRPPGDTPQKKRRNSIDISEVESSPRVQKVKQERAGARGKRKSHSDEEVETKTQSMIHDRDFFNDRTPNASADFHDLNSSKGTPPAATSTPQQRSSPSFNGLQSYLQAQSNLLEQDSEMQRGLHAQSMDSDDDKPPPIPFPAPKVAEDPQDTIKLPSTERAPSRSSPHNQSREPNLSRPSPSPTPRRQSYAHVPHTLTRHGSSASISSMSSTGSYGEGEPHDPKERERQWNRPRTISKPSPSANYSHSRTHSQPLDPRNSPSPSPSDKYAFPSPSSRSTSSASSREEDEVEPELYHERERNWNSPHPKWPRRQSLTGSRSNSPIPQSPLTSTSFDGRLRPPSRIQSPASVYASTPSLQRPRPLSFSSPRPSSPLPLTPKSGTPSLKRSLTEIKISPRTGRVRATSSLGLNTNTVKAKPVSPRSEIPVPISRIYEKSSPSLSPRSEIPVPVGRLPKSSRRQSLHPKDDYDGQVTDTDEDVPTPTLKPVPRLPADSPRRSPQQLSTDETRLQKATSSVQPPMVSPHSSPPSSPPRTPPTSAPLFDAPLTPPRILLSEAPKMEFETPPPPRGFPDLPGPPSSGSDDDVRGQETATKTPRPPGAWAYTPAPRPVLRTRSNSMPADEESASSESTPLVTTTPLPRTQSLPAQTPAPPGGWMMTPAVNGKKSVRFDSPTEAEDGILKPSGVLNTPVSPRREARIRMVDEYGQERDGTPRNKSKIRIVDAMGRVVEDDVKEEEEEESILLSIPKTRGDVVKRVENGLSGMQKSFDDELVKLESSKPDTGRAAELERMSAAARERRLAISAMRRSINDTMLSIDKPPSISPATRRYSWVVWLSLGLLVQAVIGIVMYGVLHRMTVARAYELFLTTYYDPFSPELYVYESPRAAGLSIWDWGGGGGGGGYVHGGAS